jgi:hypothetical protein
MRKQSEAISRQPALVPTPAMVPGYQHGLLAGMMQAAAVGRGGQVSMSILDPNIAYFSPTLVRYIRSILESESTESGVLNTYSRTIVREYCDSHLRESQMLMLTCPEGKAASWSPGGGSSILECLPLILSAVGRLSLGKTSYIRGAIKRMTPWTQDQPMAQTRALFHSEEQDGVWLRP